MKSESRPPLSPELRRRLLEASPAELTVLARERPELAPVVDRLLSVNSEVARALDGGPPVAARSGTPPTRRRAPARLLLPIGLAAAAALAWLVVRPGPPGPADPAGSASSPLASTGPDLTAELSVETPADFAVFPTDDPDMAVVWILNNGAD